MSFKPVSRFLDSIAARIEQNALMGEFAKRIARGEHAARTRSLAGAPGSERVVGNTLWFSLQEGSGTVLKSNLDGISAAVLGTGAHWSPLLPGFNFSGTNYAQVDVATIPQGRLRALFDLNSLAEDEQLLAFGVLSHPSGAWSGTGTLFYWGRTQSSAQGWGVKINNAGVFNFHHRAPGSSGMDSPMLQLSEVVKNNNTRTAFAFGIGRASNGDLEIASALRYLDVPGGTGNTNRSALITPLAKPSGASASCSYQSDCSLTIGGAPGNSPSNINDFMPSGTSLLNLGFSRAKKDHRRRGAVIYSLSGDMLAAPLALAT